MFGFPIETITLLVSTGFSFYMKYKAQKSADMTNLLAMSIKANQANNVIANDAAKRGTPWVRKYISVFVMSIMFGGLIIMPFFDVPTHLIMEAKQNSFLFGLVKWGASHDIITTTGFMIPPYARHTVMVITGFFFGAGFNKVTLN